MKVVVALRPSKGSNTPKKSSTFPLTLELEKDATIRDVKNAIAKKNPKYYIDRQKITSAANLPLENATPLSECNVVDGDTLYFKDLGPQIGWKTVFLIEYAGPLFIHPIFYYLGNYIYGSTFEHSKLQSVSFFLVLFHFAKRELETLFVHRFSHGTMPFQNVFKNSFHYHVLSGVNIAFWLYGPWYGKGTENAEVSKLFTFVCIFVFFFAEFSNLLTHITLRNLRPPGTRVRRIPYGYGFDWVSCPNYFFETVAWVAFSVLTNSYAAWLFVLVAYGQMYLWAIKKHKNYLKEFKDYPKNRKAIIPFVV
ncbi:hypothetical protein K493DRAFT_357633 [Basidiobolus meristosporus CBS 931.73]|uniref:very-long-chain enoyl-CoA reductase n=1 Tax=Basidiobolus meristosporus CBS 931.73 TaxID=1314790 RepID=A0A1Y1XWV5_9FUNG|nr:hypothetical protein K493DRAFT_357633 [Basidiobolus meristosporus CBS 931.73]|eukprot:ORX89824.1 hypothetical protein K493DRAFT_357633 [Basidiobolus meristosporus CBS 931.73]